MPEMSTLIPFATVALVLLVTPGPAVLYIVARSIEQGRLAGLVSTLGISVATLVHLGAAILGVSAILMSSALAFQAVKILGAIYLIYLGLRRLFFRGETAEATRITRQSLGRVFAQGMVVNLLNPKTALFFLAFLPQFIDPSRGSASAQILVLGVVFISLAVTTDGVYALLAGSVASWFRGDGRLAKVQRVITGTLLVALGIFALVESQPRLAGSNP